MSKRLLSVILSIVLVAAMLSGCGKKKEAEIEDTLKEEFGVEATADDKELISEMSDMLEEEDLYSDADMYGEDTDTYNESGLLEDAVDTLKTETQKDYECDPSVRDSEWTDFTVQIFDVIIPMFPHDPLPLPEVVDIFNKSEINFTPNFDLDQIYTEGDVAYLRIVQDGNDESYVSLTCYIPEEKRGSVKKYSDLHVCAIYPDGIIPSAPSSVRHNSFISKGFRWDKSPSEYTYEDIEAIVGPNAFKLTESPFLKKDFVELSEKNNFDVAYYFDPDKVRLEIYIYRNGYGWVDIGFIADTSTGKMCLEEGYGAMFTLDEVVIPSS